jgi:hypothetical protein
MSSGRPFRGFNPADGKLGNVLFGQVRRVLLGQVRRSISVRPVGTGHVKRSVLKVN